MTESVPRKHCAYCKNWWPQDDFVKVKRGKWGQITVSQCGNCHRARQNKALNQERFDTMVANVKAANIRSYGYFDKEPTR